MPNSCLCCKYLGVKIDAACFKWYYCKLKPGLVVGESNYLSGDYVAEACDKFVHCGKEEKG